MWEFFPSPTSISKEPPWKKRKQQQEISCNFNFESDKKKTKYRQIIAWENNRRRKMITSLNKVDDIQMIFKLPNSWRYSTEAKQKWSTEGCWVKIVAKFQSSHQHTHNTHLIYLAKHLFARLEAMYLGCSLFHSEKFFIVFIHNFYWSKWRERVDTWPDFSFLGTVFLWWKLQSFARKKKWKFILFAFFNNIVTTFHLLSGEDFIWIKL